eukprot:scaffold93248_cov19-Tisochrysis_lutea.AAC.1
MARPQQSSCRQRRSKHASNVMLDARSNHHRGCMQQSLCRMHTAMHATKRTAYACSHARSNAVPMMHACSHASGMMRKSLKVYETYQEMLNEDIKTLFMVGWAADVLDASDSLDL